MDDRRIEGTLGFLGFGNMGRAIASGLVQTGVIAPESVLACDVDPERLRDAEQIGMTPVASVAELAARADTLVLAVKPQTMDEALAGLRAHIRPETLVISIAAGISIDRVRDRLGSAIRIARAMPNTPALVGAGAAGVAMGPGCTDADRAVVRAVFEAVGICVFVEETQIDAVTAVSGSGPAYFFLMVESLTAAGVASGLPEDAAARLAAQTLYGAGKLLADSADGPGTLRARVTSKGGTTEAALKQLQNDGFERVIHQGVAAAAARSRELGR